MSYQALYRKYRSKTFDEIVGQEAIVRTLKNAINSGQISHAYLFSGPRGTGKTSIARLFAKALLCEEGVGHQCNKCENCLAVNDGSHPDLIEIDAASNSGVDEARELIDKIKYAPIKGRYKIYIIDEVHMMTNSAFNALLKTLEEPPEYVVFILCTTEPYKVLPTIVSRCQRYTFSKISDTELFKLITKVLNEEHVTASKEVIDLIVEIANGGARDALSLLDQVIAYSSDHIELKDVENLFGLATNEEKIKLLTNIKNSNVLEVLNEFNELTAKNIDVLRLVSELLDLLKDTLIYKNTNTEELITTNKLTVFELSRILDSVQIQSYIDLLLDCQKDFKTSSNPLFTFEIYLLKLSNFKVSENVKVIEKPVIVNKVEVKKEEPIQVKEETPAPTFNEPLFTHQVEEKAIKKEEPIVEQKVENCTKKPTKRDLIFTNLVSTGTSYKIDDDNVIKILASAKKEFRKEVLASWNKLEDYVDDEKFGPCATTLIDSTPFALTDEHIILINNYEVASRKVNVVENQELFSELIKKIIGKKLFVYSIDRNRSTEIKQKYLGLNQLNKLPVVESLKEIVIEQEEIE